MTADLNATQRRTLALLRAHGHLSRAEIAEKLGLSRPALTDVTRVLTELGYIEEHGVGGNSRGQPKVNLRLRAKAACVAGVFIQKDLVRLTLVDITGYPLAEGSVEPTPGDPEQACDLVCEQIFKLVRDCGIARKRLLAVGVATTGFFLGDQDRVWPPSEMARWREFRLKSALEKRLGLSVFLENDGNAAALAEHMKGAGRRFRSFLFVYLAYGVGGGLICGGRIFGGEYGNACEIGRLVPPHPAVRPTLTSLAKVLDRPVGSISQEEMTALFKGKDPRFMSFLQAAAASLHDPLGAAVILLDPAAIVVGGKFPPAVLQWFVDHLDPSYADTKDIPMLPKPSVVRSEIADAEAGLLGAALLPLHDFMSPSDA